MPKARLEPLDGLRGIAALAVSLGHLSVLLTGVGAAAFAVASFTPLAALWRGNSAVLFFFILSGFVLSLPFYSRAVSPSAFLAKRILRLYPAYWAALVLALAVLAQGVLVASDTPRWDLKLAINYFLLYGTFSISRINPVLWSLVHEVRISAVFPLVMPLVKRVPSKWLLAGSAPLALAGLVWLSPDGLTVTSGAGTLWYAWFFLLGAVLAKHRVPLTAWVARRATLTTALMLVACVALYGMPDLQDGKGVVVNALGFVVVAAGASGLMLLALGRGLVGRVLMKPPVQFMGRISYGYYLVHFPILALALHYWLGHVNSWWIAVAVIAASVVVAWGLNVGVEKPGMALGRRIAKALESRLLKPLVVRDEPVAAMEPAAAEAGL